jgi:hypothetical protein
VKRDLQWNPQAVTQLQLDNHNALYTLRACLHMQRRHCCPAIWVAPCEFLLEA